MHVTMDELVERSEILSLHLPLTGSTRGLYDAEVLARLGPDQILINTCRGGIVDEVALRQQLYEKRLGAACFDVFATEPPEDKELLNLPNFIISPHIGGSAEESILAMGRAAIEGLEKNQVPERGVFPDNY